MRPSHLASPALALAVLSGCAAAPTAPQAIGRSAYAPVNEAPNCIRSTGSRIAPPAGRCLPVAGRVITREDLDHAGDADLGRALRTLVPF